MAGKAEVEVEVTVSSEDVTKVINILTKCVNEIRVAVEGLSLYVATRKDKKKSEE